MVSIHPRQERHRVREGGRGGHRPAYHDVSPVPLEEGVRPLRVQSLVHEVQFLGKLGGQLVRNPFVTVGLNSNLGSTSALTGASHGPISTHRGDPLHASL